MRQNLGNPAQSHESFSPIAVSNYDTYAKKLESRAAIAQSVYFDLQLHGKRF